MGAEMAWRFIENGEISKNIEIFSHGGAEGTEINIFIC